MDSKRPIFVLGCARSGTSLLTRILGSHPRIAIPFESHFYNTFYPWLKFYGDLRIAANRGRLVRDFLNTEVMKDWSPRADFRRSLAATRAKNFAGVFDGVMSAWASDVGKPRWGEKTPAHAFFWPQILRDFPDLKLIHIVRDGRDVALSWRNARFGPKHVFPLACRWVEYLRTMEECKSKLARDAYFELRYEDLLAAPEATVRKLCSFLDEPFHKSLLFFYKNQTPYQTDKVNDQNVNKPIMKDNATKWPTQMTLRELRIFEAVAGPSLKRYGYETALESPHLSRLETCWIKYFEHPPARALALLRNRKGQRDALRKAEIYLSLRLNRPARGKRSSSFATNEDF